MTSKRTVGSKQEKGMGETMMVRVAIEEYETQQGDGRTVYVDVAGTMEVDGGQAVAGSFEGTVRCTCCGQGVQVVGTPWVGLEAAIGTAAEEEAEAMAETSREP